MLRLQLRTLDGQQRVDVAGASTVEDLQRLIQQADRSESRSHRLVSGQAAGRVCSRLPPAGTVPRLARRLQVCEGRLLSDGKMRLDELCTSGDTVVALPKRAVTLRPAPDTTPASGAASARHGGSPSAGCTQPHWL